MTPYLWGEKQFEWQQISYQKHGGQKKWHKIFQVLKEKTVNPDSYIQQKYPSRIKGDTTQEQKDKQFNLKMSKWFE